MIVCSILSLTALMALSCDPPPLPDELAQSVELLPIADSFGEGSIGNMIAPAGGLFILGKGDGCCPSTTASSNRPGGVCEGNSQNLEVEYRSRSHRVLRAPDEPIAEPFTYCEIIEAENNNFGEEACSCYLLTIVERSTAVLAPLAFELLEDETVRYEITGCGEDSFVDIDRVRIRVSPELDRTGVALQVWVVPAGESFAGTSPAMSSAGLANLPVDDSGDVVLRMQTRGAFDVRARLLRAEDGAITDTQTVALTTLPLPEPEPSSPLAEGAACASTTNDDGNGAWTIAVLAMAFLGWRRTSTSRRAVFSRHSAASFTRASRACA